MVRSETRVGVMSKTDAYPDGGHPVGPGRCRDGGDGHQQSGRVGGEWRRNGRERAQDLHDLPLPLMTEGTAWAIVGGARRGVCGAGRGRHAEERLRASDQATPVRVGEQPEMSDAYEATREDVQEEAAEEFVDGQRHDLRPAAVRVILPAEAHDAVGEADEPRASATGSHRPLEASAPFAC